MSRYVEPKRPKPWGAIFTPVVEPPKPPKPEVPSVAQSVAYVELRNLEGRLEDTYRNHGKHPERLVPTCVNEAGEIWREHYFTRRRQGMSHEAAVRSIESQIDVIEGRPDRWGGGVVVPGPGPAPNPGQIAGWLRVERGRLRNDAGWFQFQGISEFDLIHLARTGQRGEVDRRLRRAARAGRNVVRVLGMARNLFDLHPGQAGYDDAFDYVLEAAAALGMYVLYTAGADLQLVMSQAAFAGFLEQQARRRRDDPRILWTIINEARKNGYREADDPALLALADVLADALGHRDFGISDPLDGDDENATADMLARFEAIARRSNILLLHGSRMESDGRLRWVEHLKGLRDIVDEMRRRTGRDLWGLHEEPMGAAANREPGRRDNRAAAHVAAACTAAVLGLGYVYHYIAAQSDATPGLDEAAIATRIPASPEFRYTNANLGGSWVGPVGAWSKIRPAHDGSTAWAVGVGFSPGPLNVQSGWRVAEMVAIESEGVHCHVWRGEAA